LACHQRASVIDHTCGEVSLSLLSRRSDNSVSAINHDGSLPAVGHSKPEGAVIARGGDDLS
jgi:hypothetical protein